jgi:hypothetical protein
MPHDYMCVPVCNQPYRTSPGFVGVTLRFCWEGGSPSTSTCTCWWTLRRTHPLSSCTQASAPAVHGTAWDHLAIPRTISRCCVLLQPRRASNCAGQVLCICVLKERMLRPLSMAPQGCSQSCTEIHNMPGAHLPQRLEHMFGPLASCRQARANTPAPACTSKSPCSPTACKRWGLRSASPC